MEKKSIFKSGSTTYFYSSFFFPKETFEEVATLYAFVRIADDYVDAIPQQKEAFFSFKNQFEESWLGNKSGDSVIDDFVDLAKELEFEKAWIDAFLSAMEMDLSKSEYQTMEELLVYIHGSAEVIGLMMARIMRLPKEAEETAALLGRAMQYINFLRDLKEDNALQRSYLPKNRWEPYGLNNLSVEEANANESAFNAFYREQIEQYLSWDREARKGFAYLPKRFRIPIKTASDMYGWTAKKIAKDPMIVFEKKMKPKKLYILFIGLKNVFFPYA